MNDDDSLRQAFTDADINERRLLARQPEYRDIIEELVGEVRDMISRTQAT